jgi:5' nucleotidase, deoxy (Pyrimidine), cytosolic type C protein (NT5C)
MSDLDGVLADFTTAFVNRASETDRIAYPAPTSFEFYKEPGWDWTSAFFVARLAQWASEGLFGGLQANVEGVEAISELASRPGYAVEFYTSRPVEGHADTARWLERHFAGVQYTLRFADRHKTSNGYHAAIDDYLPNLRSLHADGVIHPVIMDQAWNRPSDEFTRVRTVTEFVSAL